MKAKNILNQLWEFCWAPVRLFMRKFWVLVLLGFFLRPFITFNPDMLIIFLKDFSTDLFSGNPLIWDGSALIEVSHNNALNAKTSVLQEARRTFLKLFIIWNAGDMAHLNLEELRELHNEVRNAIRNTVPLLNAHSWFIYWVVIQQPLYIWGFFYDVYALPEAPCSYKQFIRKGLAQQYRVLLGAPGADYAEVQYESIQLLVWIAAYLCAAQYPDIIIPSAIWGPWPVL